MSIHEGEPVLHHGAPIEDARGLLILLHGRGAGARDILGIAQALEIDSLTCLAPEATAASWFQYSFLVPRSQNEPGVQGALSVVAELVTEADLNDIPVNRVFLLGFSQGACLALEYALAHPAEYGGIYALSGGLLGPPGTSWSAEGSLAGTHVFIGSSDLDPHVPRARLDESAEAMRAAGAEVELKLYPGIGHTVTDDEIEVIRSSILTALER